MPGKTTSATVSALAAIGFRSEGADPPAAVRKRSACRITRAAVAVLGSTGAAAPTDARCRRCRGGARASRTAATSRRNAWRILPAASAADGPTRAAERAAAPRTKCNRPAHARMAATRRVNASRTLPAHRRTAAATSGPTAAARPAPASTTHAARAIRTVNAPAASGRPPPAMTAGPAPAGTGMGRGDRCFGHAIRLAATRSTTVGPTRRAATAGGKTSPAAGNSASAPREKWNRKRSATPARASQAILTAA